MKNKELWEQYQDYTRDVSISLRQLIYAGAAICWFFRPPNGSFPKPILIAMAAIIAFFFVDLSQYFISARKLRSWIRDQEVKMYAEKQTIDGDYDKPHQLDDFAYCMWNTKLVLVIITFLFIGYYLFIGTNNHNILGGDSSLLYEIAGFIWSRLGLIVTLVGTIMVALSFGKSIVDTQEEDDKGRKVYSASFLHPCLFKVGFVVIIIGFLISIFS